MSDRVLVWLGDWIVGSRVDRDHRAVRATATLPGVRRGPPEQTDGWTGANDNVAGLTGQEVGLQADHGAHDRGGAAGGDIVGSGKGGFRHGR